MFAVPIWPAPVGAQSSCLPVDASIRSPAGHCSSAVADLSSYHSDSASIAPAPPLPEAPDPAPVADGGVEHPHVPWAEEVRQPPFSRVGIGADVSPLGVGVKAAILLSRYFDARGMGNFLGYDTGWFELEGFHVDGKLHLASAGASLDWYPFNSIWRMSAGALFLNQNQLSATTTIVPGTSFTLNQEKFYSATPNAATGVTPLAGSGVMRMHSRQPALTLSGGFGRFIPRSNRHWSFPSEFGVVFMGAPTISVSTSGWVCLDQQQTECGNINSPSYPASVEFNSALQATLTKWRKDLSSFTIYPIFSYSVVYSFNIR